MKVAVFTAVLAVGLLCAPGLRFGSVARAFGAEAESAAVDGEGDRPRIGLALGGGGARGLAHLGVLHWLEEHRIPVDFVAGTSMGGLVGGAYATGIRADSLDALIRGLDWPLLLSGSPPYRLLIMRRKQDRRNILGGVDLGVADRVTTPSGLSAGHYVNLLLSRIALDHSTLASFDDLPIPFRCVAVDLVSGAEIVLDRSPLNRSLRATMAIPGVFTAVEIDSMLLVDGGIVNNVPADVVRQMGADVVLAVHVGEPLDPDERIESIAIALKRAQMITADLLTEPRLVNADLVVKPDLDGYSILAFKASDSLVARGYAAMDAVAARLLPYQLDEGAWNEHLAARQSRRRKDGEGPVGGIFLRGAAPVDIVRASRELGRKTEGDLLDPGTLEAALSDLYGWGKYEAFDYRRTSDGSGMVVETHPVAQGPPYLRLGLAVDGTETEDIEFSLKSRLLFADLAGFGSEFRADLDLGTFSRLEGEWYQPVAGPLFASARGFWGRRATVFFEQDDRVAEFWLRTLGGEAAVGYGVARRMQEIRAGWRLSDDRSTVRTGDPGLPETHGTREEVFLEWTVDTQDDPVVPYGGVRGRARGSRFLRVPDGGRPFTKTEARVDVAIPLGGRQSVQAAAAAGTAFEDTVPLFLDFTLGGPYRLGAFHRDELRGSRFLYGSLGVSRRLADGLLPLHVVLAGEAGSVSEPGEAPVFRGCGTLMVIAETPLGPGILGGSAGSGRSQVYFALGTRFF